MRGEGEGERKEERRRRRRRSVWEEKVEREWVSMTLLDTERFVKNYQQNSRIEYRGILNGKKKKEKGKGKNESRSCEKF